MTIDIFTNHQYDRVTTFVEYQPKAHSDELAPACVLLKFVGANTHVYMTMDEVGRLARQLVDALETHGEEEEAA
tara:strand:- start:21845 stop:22066 length:222 start_codon:yes stop_codon:yes gene_type:complete